MPVANSTTSMPRCISPVASESTLPCSAVMMARQPVEVALEQLAEAAQHAGAPERRRRRPLRQRGGGRGDGRVDIGLHRRTPRVRAQTPVAGLNTSP